MKNFEQKEKELKELVQPLRDWLIKNFNLHCSILIENDKIRVLSDELAIPMNLED